MSMPVKAAGERDPEADESPAQRAFRHSLKRLGRKPRPRIGDRMRA
jgi:hypothetical protein